MNRYIILILLMTMGFSCTGPRGLINKEEAFELFFEEVRKDQKMLELFFQKMPKGGDIHHHASGTPYAESYINNALEDSLYISTISYQLYRNREEALHKNDSSIFLINTLLAKNPNEKDSIIDNWSTRNYKKRGKDGHDLFFSTFSKFKLAFVGHEIKLLTEMCKKASKNNILYLETMIKIPYIEDSVAKLVQGEKEKWDADKRVIELKLNDLYEHLMEKGLYGWARGNAEAMNVLHERTFKYGVHLKFLTYGVRVSTDQPKIFSQLLLAFETAALSNNVLGVNFVAPEDNSTALKNYRTHMKMFGFLSKKYPKVKISLHAGEMVMGKGSVKKEDLKFHINDALKTANAMRIGHGVDLLKEDNYEEILKYMKSNNYAVEINLESNEVILERNTKNHPIKAYLKYGIPVCLSTDDEGVLRTNLTNQYILLVKYVPKIKYKEIKEIAFNSISHSFLSPEDKSKLLKKLRLKFELFEKEISQHRK